MKAKKSAPLGASLIVASSVFYASYGIWTTLMGNFFGGYTASALRSALVLVMVAPVALVRHQLGGFDLRRNWRYWVGASAAAVLMWGPFYYAILHAGIGVALAVNYAALVVVTFVVGWLALGERFTKDKWLATALSFVGLYLIFTPNIAKIGWLPLVAACLSGASFASISVILKRAPYSLMQSTLMLWTTSAVANAVMALIVREQAPTIGWYAQWFYLIPFAITSIAASLTYIKGLKLVEVGAAGILGLLEIVFGVAFGRVFFGERIGIVALTGIVVIIAAAAIPYVKDYNAERGTLDEGKITQ